MSIIENLKVFLESSSIHGLVYWSTTRRLSRIFWIFVVVIGFSLACYMIHLSFQEWSDNPVKTTIETLPISIVKLPKISVCPPWDTYTNLNFDMIKLGNSYGLPDDWDHFLSSFWKEFQNLDFLQHKQKLKNSFEEENQYRNWYTGKR